MSAWKPGDWGDDMPLREARLGGWVLHHDETMPFFPTENWPKMEVLYRNGDIEPIADASPRNWKDTGDVGAIIAWRVRR